MGSCFGANSTHVAAEASPSIITFVYSLKQELLFESYRRFFDGQCCLVVFDVCVEACHIFRCRRYLNTRVSAKHLLVQESVERLLLLVVHKE